MFSRCHVHHVGGVNNIESAILEEYTNPLGINSFLMQKLSFVSMVAGHMSEHTP